MKLNPRDMAKAMQRMGIQQVEVPATEVIIRGPEKDIIIQNPQVMKVNMMGQETFQITGTPIEQSKSTEPDISEEDIQTVIDQTGVTHDDALLAIRDANGDLAEAILKLSGNQ